MQISIHVFFVGIAVHTRLQEVLLATGCPARWVPSGLVIGGDQPFVRRLIGVSISPLAGSIYNMGVCDKVDREEAARLRCKETGCSLEYQGCIGDPHIVVDRCVVFLCILHCWVGCRVRGCC